MKLKEFITSRHEIKVVILSLLFLVASLSTAYGWYLFVPIVPHYGRMLATYFPTLFTTGVPLFSFFILWMYWHTKNIANRWKILRIYAIVLVTLMALCIPFHILSIQVSFGWAPLYGVLSPLFPYDQLVLMILYLILGIGVAIYVVRHRDYDFVSVTLPNPMRKRTYVAMAFVSSFTAYFLGLFFEVFFIFDYVDPNWYGMIPVILFNFVPILGFKLYFYYRHIADEDKKQHYYFRSLLIYTITTLVLLTWVIIAVIINPYLFPESLSNFFMLGFAAKVPIGFFVLLILIFVESLVAVIRYCQRYLKKSHEK